MEDGASKVPVVENPTYPPPQYSQPPQYGQPPGGPGQGAWGPPPVMMAPPNVHQNSSSTNTIVINSQPAASANKLPRTWSTGICSICDDIGICCCVMCCQPCAEIQLAVDMGESCCLPCFVPGWLIALRAKMRTQYNIQGSICDDCTTICFLGPCVLCQMMRELKLMKSVTPLA